MVGIIISAHGKYASGLKSSIELVLGDKENIEAIDFDGESTNEYEDKLENTSKNMLKEYDCLFIATDILGGSPYNIAAKLSFKDDNVFVFSGANFNLIYEMLKISRLDSNKKELFDQLVFKAKEGIGYFNK